MYREEGRRSRIPAGKRKQVRGRALRCRCIDWATGRVASGFRKAGPRPVILVSASPAAGSSGLAPPLPSLPASPGAPALPPRRCSARRPEAGGGNWASGTPVYHGDGTAMGSGKQLPLLLRCTYALPFR